MIDEGGRDLFEARFWVKGGEVFGQVVIRRMLKDDGSIDLGLLAESMLFYKDVIILLDRGSLTCLVKALDGEIIVRIIDDYNIKISYLREQFATVSRWEGGIHLHDFGQIRFGGTAEKKVLTGKGEIEEIVYRALGVSKESKNLCKNLQDRISTHRLNVEDDYGMNLPDMARQDMSDRIWVQEAARDVLIHLLKRNILQKDFKFEVIDIEKRFLIDTNLNFDYANKLYHESVPVEHSSITGAYILNHLFEARSDAYFAGRYMSGYATSDVSSKLLRKKFFDLIRKRERDVKDFDLFQRINLPEGRAIRDVINTGERSFGEFLAIVNKANKFKNWLNGKNPDDNLMSEYMKIVKAGTWVDKIPSKIFRWVGTTGLGAIVEGFYPTGFAIAAAQGISAADAVLVDKIIKGWRPDQFITGPLSDFVSYESAVNPSAPST